MCLVHQVPRLLIDGCGNSRGVIHLVPRTTPHKRVALFLAVLDHAQLWGHAVFGDHGAGNLGGLLNVVGSTCGGLAKHQFFGGAAAHGEHKPGKQFGAVVHAFIVFGGGHSMSAGTSTGQNGDLVHALDVFHRPGSQGVAGLVVGGDFLFVLGNDLGASARATYHTVGGFLQRISRDHISANTGGEQRGFVQHVFQVRSRHAGGALGQGFQVCIIGEGLALGMHLKDLFAAFQIRVGHRDLPIETPRTQQGRVQNVGTVGGGHEDHALAVSEAVHFHQQLVEGLFAFVVSAAHAGAALATNRINLVDEDDAGAVFFGLFEQVTDAGGTHTDEHFHKVRAGDGIERYACLTGHGPGQQGFTGSGWAVEQHAARDFRPECFVAAGVLQEVFDFVEFVHGFVRTGYVGKRVGGHVFGEFLGAGSTKAEHAHAAALHAVEEEHDQAEQDEHGQQHAQHGGEEVLAVDLCGVLLGVAGLHLVKDDRR